MYSPWETTRIVGLDGYAGWRWLWWWRRRPPPVARRLCRKLSLTPSSYTQRQLHLSLEQEDGKLPSDRRIDFCCRHRVGAEPQALLLGRGSGGARRACRVHSGSAINRAVAPGLAQIVGGGGARRNAARLADLAAVARVLRAAAGRDGDARAGASGHSHSLCTLSSIAHLHAGAVLVESIAPGALLHSAMRQAGGRGRGMMGARVMTWIPSGQAGWRQSQHKLVPDPPPSPPPASILRAHLANGRGHSSVHPCVVGAVAAALPRRPALGGVLMKGEGGGGDQGGHRGTFRGWALLLAEQHRSRQ